MARKNYDEDDRISYKPPFILGAILILALLGTTVTLSVNKAINIEPVWNNAVHSHMENAYYSATPELMIQYLNTAVQGMKDLGLTPNMYDNMVPWLHTPDRQMKWQYEHMQSIIERAEDIIKWRDGQNNNGQGSQLNDVYTQKINEVRHFMKDDGGWSDEIAHGAFYIKHHTFYAWIENWGFIMYVPWVLSIVGCIIWIAIAMFKNEEGPFGI